MNERTEDYITHLNINKPIKENYKNIRREKGSGLKLQVPNLETSSENPYFLVFFSDFCMSPCDCERKKQQKAEFLITRKSRV